MAKILSKIFSNLILHALQITVRKNNKNKNKFNQSAALKFSTPPKEREKKNDQQRLRLHQRAIHEGFHNNECDKCGYLFDNMFTNHIQPCKELGVYSDSEQNGFRCDS